MKKISIVVPMYNESKMIDTYFETVYKHIDGIVKTNKNIAFEIVAVNDGSNDDTLTQLTKWHEKIINVSVVSLTRNFGQEPAVFAGLEKAKGDAVIVMDCDLQDPPELIVKMIEKWEQGFDVVNARRVSRISDTKFKRDTAGAYYNLLNKLSYKVKYPHNVNNFRLISRRVLDVILKMPEKNKFYRGLVPFTGFKSVNIDIERRERQSGESKYNLKAMLKLAIDGITATTVKPLSWAFYFGITFILSGFFGAVAVMLMFFYGINFNITLFGILCGLAFFTGFLLVFMGILGLYIGKSFEEIKGRPFNIIDLYLPAKIFEGDNNEDYKKD